jgi:predicted nucleotidyltransferase
MNATRQKATKPFDISIWRRASIGRRKWREQQRLRAVDEVNKALQELSIRYKWEEVYLFGSITKPNQFGEHSDIDIGIKGLEKFLQYRFISDLSGLLERAVDVVRLEDCTFSEAIESRGTQWKKKE